MQNLIGIGVADTAEEPRVGKRALERVVLAAQTLRELRAARREDLEPPGVKKTQGLLPLDDTQRGAPSGARFGEGQRSIVKLQSCQHCAPRQRDASLVPVQSPRDHEM